MGHAEIRGWSGGDVQQIYRDAVSAAKDGDTLIEVGVAYGRSLAYLARQAIDSKKKLRILGVDSWLDEATAYGGPENNALVREAGSYYEACCLEMMTHAPEEYKNVRLLKGESAATSLKVMGMEGIAVSFVFIDADHSYESVLADIYSWRRVVAPGGTMAGHDLIDSFPGVERAVKEVFGPTGFERCGDSWRVRL